MLIELIVFVNLFDSFSGLVAMTNKIFVEKIDL
jgi:hypothetical protein